MSPVLMAPRSADPVQARLSRLRTRLAAFLTLPLLVAAAGDAQEQRKPDFASRVDLVTMDVVVRDNKGQFLPDLKREDFEVLEDGVAQTLVSFSLTHGGRSYNIMA